jgi:hypothetical protein
MYEAKRERVAVAGYDPARDTAGGPGGNWGGIDRFAEAGWACEAADSDDVSIWDEPLVGPLVDFASNGIMAVEATGQWPHQMNSEGHRLDSVLKHTPQLPVDANFRAGRSTQG